MIDVLAQIPQKTVKQQAIASQAQTEYQFSSYVKQIQSSFLTESSLSLIAETPLPLPQFHKNQTVCFVGGTGKIASRKASGGVWFYQIEMAQGPEPEMGRIGSETTILLDEADIQAVLN